MAIFRGADLLCATVFRVHPVYLRSSDSRAWLFAGKVPRLKFRTMVSDDSMNEENVKHRQGLLKTVQEVEDAIFVLSQINQENISNAFIDKLYREGSTFLLEEEDSGFNDAWYTDIIKRWGNPKACAPTAGADPESYDEVLKEYMLRLCMSISTVTPCLSDEHSLPELVDGIKNCTIPHPVKSEQLAFNRIRAGNILIKHYASVKRNDVEANQKYLDIGKQLGMHGNSDPHTVTAFHAAGEIPNSIGLAKVANVMPCIYGKVGGGIQETARLGTKNGLKKVDHFLKYVDDFPADKEGGRYCSLKEYYTGEVELLDMRCLEDPYDNEEGSIAKAEAALLAELNERLAELKAEAAAAVAEAAAEAEAAAAAAAAAETEETAATEAALAAEQQ